MTKEIVIRDAEIEKNKFNFVSVGKDDIRLNACIFFYDEDEELMIPMVVDEIMNLNDEFKAFSANGCRYGLEGFYKMMYYL